MAKAGHNFSPKDFSCWVKAETVAGTSVAGSGMYALNVDSVSYPSLNVNQALDVRSGGRFLRDDDFYQDNVLRQVELSLSGVLHNDVGHKLLLSNICNDYSGDISVATTYAPPSIVYWDGDSAAVENATAGDTLSIVIAAPDLSSPANSRHLIFSGCVVTNFTISADTGTDSGRFKFSCTLATGKKPDLAGSGTIAGTAYANSTDAFLHSSSGHLVGSLEVIMNSFTVTLDNPAIGVGAYSTGFEQMVRGTEFAITFDTQVKYDGNTKLLVNQFDTQSVPVPANCFEFTNNNAFGIDIDNGVLTNVAYSEGDIMMLDVSGKASSDGSTALIAIDVSS